jgi:hypothetical protein
MKSEQEIEEKLAIAERKLRETPNDGYYIVLAMTLKWVLRGF